MSEGSTRGARRGSRRTATMRRSRSRWRPRRTCRAAASPRAVRSSRSLVSVRAGVMVGGPPPPEDDLPEPERLSQEKKRILAGWPRVGFWAVFPADDHQPTTGLPLRIACFLVALYAAR